MSLIPLTITTPSGSTEHNTYQIPPRYRPHAAEPITNRAGTIVIGDRLELPTPLEIDVELARDTLAEATLAAFALIAAAQEATTVTTYEGALAVRALLGYEMSVVTHDTVALRLRWAPATATPTVVGGAVDWSQTTGVGWSQTTGVDWSQTT